MFNNCTVLSLAATGGGAAVVLSGGRHKPLNFGPPLLMPKLLL